MGGLCLSRHPNDDRLELTIRFVDEEESQALNRDYREKISPPTCSLSRLKTHPALPCRCWAT
ncbi:hypothetical protein HAALTHF_46530n [Vreelandella aquamarina]|nr:hypothetical protein HAALTHF_46530n [Halomonas axialensis]